MKPTIIAVTFLILLGSQNSFGQITLIKGKFIDYETGYVVPGVTVNYPYNGGPIGTFADINGNFELKIEGNTGYLFFGSPIDYPIKFLNIPAEEKLIDFGEIKMVYNYLTENDIVGGYSPETSKYQIEKDNKLRKEVLKRYRLKVLGKKLKPYFEGPLRHTQYIVFDLKKK